MGDPQEHAPLRWRKSTASGGGDCVEVAVGAGVALVRDSKDPSGPILSVSLPAWKTFLAGLREGLFP